MAVLRVSIRCRGGNKKAVEQRASLLSKYAFFPLQADGCSVAVCSPPWFSAGVAMFLTPTELLGPPK